MSSMPAPMLIVALTHQVKNQMGQTQARLDAARGAGLDESVITPLVDLLASSDVALDEAAGHEDGDAKVATLMAALDALKAANA